MKVGWDQLHAWRLRRQFVDPHATGPVQEVVRRLCGVQAQVPAAADLAIELRRQQPPPDEVSQALASQPLMRTWAMRGTLHLLDPEEAGAYLALPADLRTSEKPTRKKKLRAWFAELDDELLEVDVRGRDRIAPG